MHTYKDIQNTDIEKKRDYHIMLRPSIRNQAELTAHSLHLSVSAYIERALLHELQSDK